MKKIILPFLFLCLATQLPAQNILIKFSSDLKRMGTEYLLDFKNTRGKVKSEDGNETVYYSKYKLAGTVESSNLIHKDKLTKTWTFTADIDREKLGMDELKSLVPQVLFIFGQLHGIASGVDWVYLYIPEKKKKTKDEVKIFHVSIYDGRYNPNDATGGSLQLKLGGDLSLREK